MTAPIWMASPPEVHSALLSSGPGPGPLLAAAGAWNSLSIEYTEVADELSALVAAVRAGAWEGTSAESYAAANAPYLAWLARAAADAAATAAQHETAAGAYTAALGTMPTLGELAANHVTHTALLATNFFGINTIPIALNEADYVRMWIQAATTMTIYQGTSTAGLTTSPHTTAAPAIMKSDPAATSDPWPSLSEFLTQLSNVINSFGAGSHDETLASYLFGVPPGTNPLSLLSSDAATDAAGYPAVLSQLVAAAGYNPVFIVLAYAVGGFAIVYDLMTQILQFFVTFPLLLGLFPAAALPAALAGLAAGGVVGIAEVAAHLPTGVESTATAPIAPGVSPAPAPVSGPAAPAPAAAAPVPAFAPAAPAAPAFAAPSAPGAPPPPGGPGPFPYLVGGANRMASQTSAKAIAKKKAPEPDIAVTPAAAAAAARAKNRVRRRWRTNVEMPGRGYVFADLEVDTGQDAVALGGRGPDAPTATTDRGAGNLGFAGTVRREAAAEAAGLTTLADDAFGGAPTEPMMPSTWAPHEFVKAKEWTGDT